MKAVFLQELFVTRRSFEVLIDLFFFSAVAVVMNGFITLFLTQSVQSVSMHYLILGTLLWEVIRINQYTASVSSLWNIWSGNLTNMFITPLSLFEYISAHLLSGLLKALIIFLGTSVVALTVFGFNIFGIGGWNLILHLINLTMFSWWTGLILLGLIFRWGTRVQALAWSLIFLFQPLTASFFPLSILPNWLQAISLLLPPTYVFEAARAQLASPATDVYPSLVALGLNILYLFLAIWLFSYMFRRSRQTGQFARNEE